MGSLTAADWVAAALDRLGEAGVAAVRVEPLAQVLGVSKGSFYWHFDNRDALLRAVLAAWEEVGTSGVIERADAHAGTPRERAEHLLVTVFSQPRFEGVELAVRAWARHDPAAREVVTRVDGRRVRYVARLLEDSGIAPPQAAWRAALTYRALIGEFALRSYGTPPLPPEALAGLAEALLGP